MHFFSDSNQQHTTRQDLKRIFNFVVLRLCVHILKSSFGQYVILNDFMICGIPLIFVCDNDNCTDDDVTNMKIIVRQPAEGQLEENWKHNA